MIVPFPGKTCISFCPEWGQWEGLICTQFGWYTVKAHFLPWGESVLSYATLS